MVNPPILVYQFISVTSVSITLIFILLTQLLAKEIEPDDPICLEIKNYIKNLSVIHIFLITALVFNCVLTVKNRYRLNRFYNLICSYLISSILLIAIPLFSLIYRFKIYLTHSNSCNINWVQPVEIVLIIFSFMLLLLGIVSSYGYSKVNGN